MLKDALGKILKTQDLNKTCKLGHLIDNLDKDTAKTFIDVLKSEASTMSLVRLLKSEGLPIGREFLAEKRNTCFKDAQAMNRCCMNNKEEQ